MQVGDVVQGRYEVEQLVGQGGMGRVFRAADLVLGRAVALKVVDEQLLRGTADDVDRVLAEARLAARVRHPNVVQVLDAVVPEGEPPVLVLEFVDGPSLAEVVRTEAPLPVDRALDLLGGIAAGLEAVHAQQLVHRDVKPDNVLLDHGVPRLTDFGIARSTTATATVTMTLRGSVAYVAPEQATGDRVGPRADVYALACVACTLLTGRPPFTAEEPLGVVHQHATSQPPDVRERRRDVPDHVATAILAAMVKDPDDRTPTAAVFAAALGRPIGGVTQRDATTTRLPARDGGDTRDGTSVLGAAAPGAATGLGAAAAAREAPTTAIDDRSAPPSTPPPAAPGADARDPDDRDRRTASVPVVIGAVVVAALLGALAVGALGGDDGSPTASPTAASEPPTATPTPTPSAAPTTPAPTPSQPPEASPRERTEAALLDLREVLRAQRSAGEIEPDRAAKVDDRVSKATEKLREDELNEVSKELRELRKEIDEGLQKEEMTAGAASALSDATQVVEQELSALEVSERGRPDEDEDQDD